jgi:predicted phage baseplate assembly protein
LTAVTESVDPLDDTPLYEVAWSAEDALPISLVISRRVDDLLVESISIARGNVLLADHGLTLRDSDQEQALDPPEAPADGGRYAPRLRQPDLTYSAELGGAQLSVAKSLAQDPRLAKPQLWLESNGERWNAVLDLLGSEHDAAEYVVEIDDQRRGHVRFGDGEHGRRLPAGTRFAARYRLGNGATGNVGPETISAALVPGGGFVRVRNPLSARGGADFEAIEDVKQYAPAAFKTQRRAVTLADYETAAKLYPGVQQARAEFRWLASWYTVVLAIDRAGGAPIDDTFRAGFTAFMEERRMAGYDLEVREPVYVPLDVTVRVCLRKGTSRSAVLRELSERLGSGSRGLFHPDRLTFGQRVYVSPILREAAAIAGVDHARLVRFKRFREPATTELADGYLEVSGLELPQLANDASFPERGLIRFQLEGGV